MKGYRAVLIAALLLISLMPLVASADDDLASSTLMFDGQSVTENVDYDGDAIDWWKIYAYTGDVLEIDVSSSMSNPMWICINDGYTGKVKITDSSEATLAGDNTFENGASSTSLSTNIGSEGWYHVRVKSEDTACNDGIDYTLKPKLDQLGRDTDDDGAIDIYDDCPSTQGASIYDRNGCPDSDLDGWSDPDPSWTVRMNHADAFHLEPTQWSDEDSDGSGDNWGNSSWTTHRESEKPVIGAYVEGAKLIDACPSVWGNSSQDRLGCFDQDGDGWSNPAPDWPPIFNLECARGADAFPHEPTQWCDRDGDGFGDEVAGFESDSCVDTFGNSTRDRFGCPDLDQDGSSDPVSNWTMNNGADAFRQEPTQWTDSDGDRWGDNYDPTDPPRREVGWPGEPIVGAVLVDDFPLNPTQWRDSDRDGYGDNFADRAMLDNRNESWPGEWIADASRVDAFPLDPTQYIDSDGDGWGDNFSSESGDSCPYIHGTSSKDRKGCADADNDGWSDPDELWLIHPLGPADAFPDDPTQWRDTDGDRYGDESTRGATQPDYCPRTFGNSTRDRWGCIDSDGDGTSDPTSNWEASPFGEGDAFPTSEDLARRFPSLTEGELWSLAAEQWADTDGDGWGDAASSLLHDACPLQPGRSSTDRRGCPDSDGDGVSDLADDFDFDPTQFHDEDGDGFGDAEDGHQPDACPNYKGSSVMDRFGCIDDDGDGWSNGGDRYPSDSLQWSDTDGDGFADNPLGNNRDDCPIRAGTSSKDRQGCPDEDGNGLSSGYNRFEANFLEVSEDPTGSSITWIVWAAFGLVGLLLVALLRRSPDDDEFGDLTDPDAIDAAREALMDSPYLAAAIPQTFNPTAAHLQAEALAHSPYAGAQTLGQQTYADGAMSAQSSLAGAPTHEYGVQK